MVDLIESFLLGRDVRSGDWHALASLPVKIYQSNSNLFALALADFRLFKMEFQ